MAETIYRKLPSYLAVMRTLVVQIQMWMEPVPLADHVDCSMCAGQVFDTFVKVPAGFVTHAVPTLVRVEPTMGRSHLERAACLCQARETH